MTEHQPETSAKEVVKVHVEYKDKDGNVYSMNDVEVPVQASIKNTEDTSSNTEETNAVFSPEVLEILKGVGLSNNQEK
ncbi:hypothetical protein [uncultured Granulicatella sp.]|jgi:hypothetical protein|uniref:hypothetical protein n=1 Tax=uncultured Granulicatella sp. TaxID=316089 RepID=UPI0028E836A4|nr:hypothetical protein [uncultured Granulicatella sp.]